jgi:transglutaminase-like putative cysteine protease
MAKTELALDFLARARREALRYGPDPWLWVRELVQNARDAGASRATFQLVESAHETRVLCRDDGEGMSFADAKRYLFSLYASSKEGQTNKAGRFGVGFWSILRFEPQRIVIASHQRGQNAWRVELDANLEIVALEPDLQTKSNGLTGTEILLIRGGGDGHDLHRLIDAAKQNTRFVRQRDHAHRALEIFVNDVAIHESFELPGPSIYFEKGNVRGVVALAERPGVELFSRGLRVRVATTLEDLRSPGSARQPSRIRFAEVPDGLAPRILLDCEDLELLLSRSDARESKSLQRAIDCAHEYLHRLINQELCAIRKPSAREALAGFMLRLGDMPTWWKVLFGGALGAVLSLGCSVVYLQWIADPAAGLSHNAPARVPTDAGASSISPPVRAPTALSNRVPLDAAHYRGPTVDPLEASNKGMLDLHYEPSTNERIYLRAFHIDDPQLTYAPEALAPLALPRSWPPCETSDACLTLVQDLEQRSSPLEFSLPIPVNYQLVAAELWPAAGTTSKHALSFFGSVESSTRVRVLAEPHARIFYKVAPIKATRHPTSSTPSRRSKPSPAIAAIATALAERVGTDPHAQREAALQWIARAVAYSGAADVAREHRDAIARGEDFIDRALRIGRGDCDVQSGVLAALLQHMDQEARLAIGYVGRNGEVAALPHAWVEFRGPDSSLWSVLDPTPSAAQARPDESSHVVAGRSPLNQELTLPEQPQDTSSAAGRRIWPQAQLLATGFALALFVLVLLLSFRRLRIAPLNVHSSPNPPYALLSGALRQPESYRHFPEIFERELLPCWETSQALSLARARQLARGGNLYCAAGRSKWTLWLTTTGSRVLDGSSEIGKKLAPILGAIDLDDLQKTLDAGLDHPLYSALQRFLDHELKGVKFRVSPRHQGECSCINLAPWPRWRKSGPCRFLILAPNDPLLLRAHERFTANPAFALFLLVQGTVAILDLPNCVHEALVSRAAKMVFLGAGS